MKMMMVVGGLSMCFVFSAALVQPFLDDFGEAFVRDTIPASGFDFRDFGGGAFSRLFLCLSAAVFCEPVWSALSRLTSNEMNRANRHLGTRMLSKKYQRRSKVRR